MQYYTCGTINTSTAKKIAAIVFSLCELNNLWDRPNYRRRFVKRLHNLWNDTEAEADKVYLMYYTKCDYGYADRVWLKLSDAFQYLWNATDVTCVTYYLRKAIELYRERKQLALFKRHLASAMFYLRLFCKSDVVMSSWFTCGSYYFSHFECDDYEKSVRESIKMMWFLNDQNTQYSHDMKSDMWCSMRNWINELWEYNLISPRLCAKASALCTFNAEREYVLSCFDVCEHNDEKAWQYIKDHGGLVYTPDQMMDSYIKHLNVMESIH